jgi:hypothetical protein
MRMHAARPQSVQSRLAPVAQSLADGIVRLAQGLTTPRAASDELDEARELLAYWERRARRLPRWALMRRREARAMAVRWHERVRDAERRRYGHGLRGAAAQVAIEHRMPTSVARRARQAARVAAYAAATCALALALMVAAVVVAVVEAITHAF